MFFLLYPFGFCLNHFRTFPRQVEGNSKKRSGRGQRQEFLRVANVCLCDCSLYKDVEDLLE